MDVKDKIKNTLRDEWYWEIISADGFTPSILGFNNFFFDYQMAKSFVKARNNSIRWNNKVKIKAYKDLPTGGHPVSKNILLSYYTHEPDIFKDFYEKYLKK